MFGNSHEESLSKFDQFAIGNVRQPDKMWMFGSGIPYFFDGNYNLLAGKDPETILISIGNAFGCGCQACGDPIDKLERFNRDTWMKYFHNPKNYIENLVKKIKEEPKLTNMFSNVNLEILMERMTTNPNNSLGRYDGNCTGFQCKEVDSILKKQRFKNFFSENDGKDKEKIKSDISQVMYDKLRGDANTRNFHNYFYKDSSDDEFDF